MGLSQLRPRHGDFPRRARRRADDAAGALDFRFDPHTLAFGSDSGAGQYGNTFDNWGHRFFCTNRNPIITTVLPADAMHRNPFFVAARANYDVAPSGGDSRVYPLVEMKSNYLSHAGTHTAACGVTAYRGDLLGDEFAHSVFTCEPVGNLVTRAIVRPDGVTLTSDRARAKADFLASTDTWFRPASLATGPDGALYLADMYRLWVEHPRFLPDDVAARLDWRAGDDRGRIYRIAPAAPSPEAATPRAFTPPRSTEDCVTLVADANGWRRELGRRLLVERQDTSAVPALRQLLSGNDDPLTRLHALWTLDGLESLTSNNLATALGDDDAFVRAHGVRIAAPRMLQDDAVFDRVIECADDDEVQVRLQVALALGQIPGDVPQRVTQRNNALTQLALRDGDDAWFAQAVLTSARDCAGGILAGLVDDQDFANSPTASRTDFVTQLASCVGARGDRIELAALLTLVTSPGAEQTTASDTWWRDAALIGLATGLPRHRGELGRTSLTALLDNPPNALAEPAARAKALLSAAAEIAVDDTRPTGQRTAAVQLLAYRPFADVASAFDALLAPGQPLDVQLAAIDAMQSGGTQAAEIVLEQWPALGPRARAVGQSFLLRRTETTRQLLDAMADGRVSPAAVGVDDRVRLLRHGDANIQALAESLFGGAISANRREVAERYRAALTLDATPQAGAQGLHSHLCEMPPCRRLRSGRRPRHQRRPQPLNRGAAL
ncbi:MAG: hypothetical protein R3C10_14170 [Pirellulales bacterium]